MCVYFCIVVFVLCSFGCFKCVLCVCVSKCAISEGIDHMFDHHYVTYCNFAVHSKCILYDVVPYPIGIEKRTKRKAKRRKLETSEESTDETTSSSPSSGELRSQPIASSGDGASLV